MAITFPTTLDSLTNPISSDKMNSPSHATQHANANDAIEALEAKVGVNSSAVTTSHDYKIAALEALTGATYPAVTYATTTDTLSLTDAGCLIYYSNAALVTVTVPTNASVAFPVGTRMVLMSTGAGGLTLTTTSLTLLGSSPFVTIAQNEAMYLEKVATDTWAIIGGTS